MLRTLFSWLLTGGAAFALAACCGSVACDKQDDYADALFFKFNLDTASTQGFARKDIDTVYLKRYTKPTNPAVKKAVETIQFLRTQRQDSLAIVLNNNTPFTTANNLKLDGYEYALFVVHRVIGSKPDTVRYTINNIQLKGSYQGDGCCTYWVNQNKSAQISQTKTYGVPTNTITFEFRPNGQTQRRVYTLNRY
ncbi:hypothetical protein [Hymenobacter crusticola]|uniref:Uncharacterized protein n=1 Tax=Hymenobacter crusticola TaxID=1770526 RepID=A0A243WBY1_9BACT|nr:hypothetical protein [Hymenobacter crusticola]OUJ72518.1 hypothetical protein BXP70_18335 [Hymenobacter crusticola]